MNHLDIMKKTPPARLSNVPSLVFENTSQYKPKIHIGDSDSDPELIILNNQISRNLKISFNKKADQHKTADE